MKKLFKFIAVLLSLILIVVGCVIANSIYEKKKFADAEYEFVVNMKAQLGQRQLPDIVEKTKSLEEDKSLLKEKEEFMQLFERFCGFSLPDYFFLPKNTDDYTDGYAVYIDERFMDVSGWLILKKNDALEILNYLRNDNSWETLGPGWSMIKSPKAKEICTKFAKNHKYNESLDYGNGVSLDFIYDEENDFYFVELMTTLERDPPPGTSWPELNFH